MFLASIKQVYRWVRHRSVVGIRLRLIGLYAYDRKRFARYVTKNRQMKEAQLAAICFDYHRLEKGFTMPQRHMPFGEEAVKSLLQKMKQAQQPYANEFIFRHAVAVLKRYCILHQEEGAWEKLSLAVRGELEAFLENWPDIAPDEIIEVTREEYFSHNGDAFPLFAATRHSVRSLCGSVSLRQIEQAVELARTAPSACNRQHVRVHCICDKSTKENVLALQNGNRGFGHLADKLLIVTTDVCDILALEERNDPYVNAGIFLMNLSYALHYHKVAHCILNWFAAEEQDKALRCVAEIPDNECIVCIIACGDCPEKFLLASSPRKPLSDVLTIHGA